MQKKNTMKTSDVLEVGLNVVAQMNSKLITSVIVCHLPLLEQPS